MPDLKYIHEWTDDEIRDFYDLNPNISILTYAGMLGMTGGEVKEILMDNMSMPYLYRSIFNPQEE
jgi:hypothetical protein